MERDAPPTAPVDPASALPPVPWDTVRKVGVAGSGLIAAAVGVGIVATALGATAPWVLSTARLWLVAVGAVTVGLALSWRPDLWQSWALAGAASLLAVFGTPAHWDSFRLLFGVLTVAAVVGTLVMRAAPVWRPAAVSALLLFHFCGIFTATASPGTGALPPPWLIEQSFQRVFNPYLQFVYLRNAYHFYSPEPGPASLVCCLLKTETGEEVRDGVPRKTYEYRWVVLPRRPADVKDPLGLTYYRRLSLTEQVARMYPGLAVQSEQFEKSEVRQRRAASGIPLVAVSARDADQPVSQYRIPNPDIQRYVIPSYAQHVLMENTPDDDAVRLKTTVKIYRLEHRTLDVGEFTGVTQPNNHPIDPYHPATYRPYFLGEFGFVPDPNRPGKTKIDLINPQEPMLYWLVPVLPRPEGAPPDPDGKDYLDFLSQHAGVPRGQEFPWGQLR
jgi:hypothetical protein